MNLLKLQAKGAQQSAVFFLSQKLVAAGKRRIWCGLASCWAAIAVCEAVLRVELVHEYIYRGLFETTLLQFL
jgi:hypothetical protein